MVDEAPLEETEAGLVPDGDGWFILNARDARWYAADGRPALCIFESGKAPWSQLGMNICVLWPGQPMSKYHWEADQEDFLVVSGEAHAIVDDDVRQLVAWDLFHCPPKTGHTIVGGGEGPCVIVAVGSRQFSGTPRWGSYCVNEVAARYGASVRQETADANEAYADVTPHRQPTGYQDGWLPD
jgi:uncharacterized cupin superfamily protein